MIVTSLDNDKVKKLSKLQQKKYRDEFNLYIVEGEHLVEEAYKSGCLKELLVSEDYHDSLVDVPCTYYSREVMKKISSMDTASNIMGLCDKKKDNCVIGEKIVILDGIQDPGNLGTIIRSSLAFNIDTIVLTENTVDLYNPKVLRATQGMFFHINIVSMKGVDVIEMLKNNNIPVYGTDVNNGEDVRNLSSEEKEKFALVMGNEGNGVRKEISDLCTKNLYINMNDKVESLNVGVATSILLYELGR